MLYYYKKKAEKIQAIKEKEDISQFKIFITRHLIMRKNPS